ncbi:SDR family NAD(P)-dependent oxidoreductase [Rhodococcus sp. NPDC058514]|uniref:SDR family NAD(P)-dependent oxidoreductase n=1 Tax=unclassified Rhodococcus (in: high G+C Gram-positive bacteria) TaxID=192944 RepID=UPI003665EFE3
MTLLGELRQWRAGARKQRRMRDLTGAVVAITGAGSGIGRETALAFAREGATVAVSDIDLAAVQRTADQIRAAGGTVSVHQLDVADEAAVREFADAVRAAHGVADVVVNNAGIGYSGKFLDTPQDRFERVMDINFWGVVYGCRAFAEQMRARGTGGHIVNLSSAAAFTPQKRLAAYATSKAAVFMLSDCLRAELLPDGIGVTAICPGIVHTNITATTEFAKSSAAEQSAQQRRVTDLYRKRNFTPDRVATEIVKSVKRNRAVVPVTPEAHVFRALGRLSPGSMRVGARLDLE